MEIEILSVKRHPTWKFWKVDQWEVTVKVNGTTKKVSIYSSPPHMDYAGETFMDYVVNKVMYGTQWEHRKINEEQDLKEMEKALQKLIGSKRSVKT